MVTGNRRGYCSPADHISRQGSKEGICSMLKGNTLIMITTVLLFACSGQSGEDAPVPLTKKEELGKKLFFDTTLSNPTGQSCASCHGVAVGFTGPTSEVNATTAVYEGAVPGRFGNRKPPSAAYASFSPDFHWDVEDEEEEGLYVGGQFWDGRATDVVEQAKGPFINPVEQAGPDERYICRQVAKSNYAPLFRDVFGRDALDTGDDVERTYHRIAEAIGAYEASAEINRFSSKYDYYLAGKVELTAQETLGLELFEDEERGNCAECHPSRPSEDGTPPLFTDFTYDNLGIPRNPDNPYYRMPPDINPDGTDWIDPGLGGFTGEENELGKMKVPTLRNVDLRPYPEFIKAFGHNGYFKSLIDIVHFYNTRDTGEWPPPEEPRNVNNDELGDLGLTAGEEEAIVAFMRTLSDGYRLSDPGADHQ